MSDGPPICLRVTGERSHALNLGQLPKEELARVVEAAFEVAYLHGAGGLDAKTAAGQAALEALQEACARIDERFAPAATRTS